MIRKLLIANRGEIACRILRTANSMGIECAVVYSEADSHALHVQMADIAFCIGPPAATESYLDAGKIIAVAREWNADAIHPGYGFLSENAQFAALCEDNGILFVGPDSQVIAAMGSKARAKELMTAAGVPLLPGYHGQDQAPEHLQQQAQLLGYPLLIKAVAGGGGRGLRVVHSEGEFIPALHAVQREAKSAFADDRVLLEKYLPSARHIEVQIVADQQGNYLHLFERDCSMQRRHQKLIEEAPAPGLTDKIREKLYGYAIKAARELAYTGVGTVEFLYQQEECYFLEMNTRLQVEHGVTEAVCGIDLVEWQLLIAQGESLPRQQNEIKCTGWAIEARINAESPLQDFLPTTGSIRTLHWPALPSLRIDAGFRSGDRIGPHYDSLLAKLIVHAETRTMAIRQLQLALQTTHMHGPDMNLAFLATLLGDADFVSGNLSTQLLHEKMPAWQNETRWQLMQQAQREPEGNGVQAGFGALQSWRSVVQNHYSRRFHYLGREIPGHQWTAGDTTTRPHEQTLKAPLPGRIIAVSVEAGACVSKGQTLLIIEAMKMEHTLVAPTDCVVATVLCQENDTVQPEQILIEFVPSPKTETKSNAKTKAGKS
ncbi:MAG: biotin carboxylase N-terminal domain-containing protein [Pseudomonadales bacterium]|nr:biotin carboxylase N-terminal domain-containing protein [Pseudomonadales bacterium]